MFILVVSLNCLDQDGQDREKIETCNIEKEDEDYCVFRQLGGNLNSAERGCADKDDIALKSLYNLAHTGCIVCRNVIASGEPSDCKRSILNDDPGDLEHNEMICFCKKDQCNQCAYKDDLGCEKFTLSFEEPTEVEICHKLDKIEHCKPKIGSNTTTNADEVTTHLGNQNKTEFHGNTVTTESNVDNTKSDTNVDGDTTKQGGQNETDAGGAITTMKANAVQFSFAFSLSISSTLISIFAI